MAIDGFKVPFSLVDEVEFVVVRIPKKIFEGICVVAYADDNVLVFEEGNKLVCVVIIT